jgi:hypothetical protein
MSESNRSIDEFLAQWTVDDGGVKDAFLRIKAHLDGLTGTTIEIKDRPGVSWSIRAGHPALAAKPLYAMVDVVDDDPDDRWLSVCFYAAMVADPDELGDFVPAGLLGEDAVCFDVDAEVIADDDDREKLLAYVCSRLSEAHTAASGA